MIDTLREKSLGAFKEGQFKEGPTLALVVVDRLLLPGGMFDLAPYYYADFNDGGIRSGVLWHMAYGRSGTPIFRLPEFAGAKSLDGHLDRLGLFVDEMRPFWGPGLVVLHRAQCGRRAYGSSIAPMQRRIIGPSTIPMTFWTGSAIAGTTKEPAARGTFLLISGPEAEVDGQHNSGGYSEPLEVTRQLQNLPVRTSVRPAEREVLEP